MYVYIRSEPGLWTVGFYEPEGKWQAESDHVTAERAAERVACLNGRLQKAEDVAKLPVPDLRDWFAGQALAGLFAGQSVSMPFTEGHEKGMAKAAVRAYAAADAMLAERTKPIRQCELCGRSMGEEKGDLHDACIAHEQHAGE